MKVWITLDKVDGSRSVVKGPIWLDEINTHGMLFYLNQADVVGITFTSADAFAKLAKMEVQP